MSLSCPGGGPRKPPPTAGLQRTPGLAGAQAASLSGMPTIPERRQRVRPPWTVVLVALVALAALGAVWFAVGAAVGNGGEECAGRANATSERCR